MKLVISEKEIAARRIAKILSGDGVSENKVYGVPVHSLKLGSEEYKIIGLKGHILKVDFPKEYANWFKVAPADLITAKIEKVPIQKSIIRALKKIADETTEIIIATDYDREGELIGYDALQIIKEKNRLVKARRAKFSALTVSDINKAFSKLSKIDSNLAFAGRARQDIDLIWGATLTRFISLAAFQIKENFLSVGRVQSPTLTIIVDREIEIKSFIPTPYWVISVELKTESGEEFEAFHRKKRFLEKEDAEKVYKRLGEEGIVSEVKETIRDSNPPPPFNTTSLIVSANAIGFTAPRTINIAENLYMNGYISYPRTDNTVYPSSINLRKITEELGKSLVFREMSEEVLSREKIIASRGKKRSTDHPPIYPTSTAKKEDLNSEGWKLYELIVRRFICSLLPPAVIKSVSAKIDINGELFIARGSNVLKANWIRFYPYYKHKDIFIPDLKQKQCLSVVDKNILNKKTIPPARYTQGKLVEKMDELGLGTKATRHTIIQTLINRGYVNGNPLVPYEKAIAVVKMLKMHAEKISSPEMTSELEMYMDGIARGDETKEEVVDKSRKLLKEIMINLNNKKDEISQEIKKAIKEDFIVGKCTNENCDGNLIIRTSRKTKKRFIGCSAYPNCNNTFPLPQWGMIINTKNICKHCGHPIIKVVRKGKRPWNLCINNNCPEKDEKYKNQNNKK